MLDLKSNSKTKKTEIKKQAFRDSFVIRLIEKINRSFNLILIFLIIIFVGSLIFSSYWLYSQNLKPLQASIYDKENSRFDLERQLKTLQDEKLSIDELNISNMQIFQILPQRRELLGVFTQLDSGYSEKYGGRKIEYLQGKKSEKS